MLIKDPHLPFLELWKAPGMVTIIMSNVVISTAHVVIIMFNTLMTVNSNCLPCMMICLKAQFINKISCIKCKQNM